MYSYINCPLRPNNASSNSATLPQLPLACLQLLETPRENPLQYQPNLYEEHPEVAVILPDVDALFCCADKQSSCG
jgi:hypothetical protein